MAAVAGYQLVRVAEIPWEDRVNVDGWPSRAGMYYDDRARGAIGFPTGATLLAVVLS